MYTLVLAAFLTTGNEVPDFGRRGGCHGCHGCWGGCYGGCWGGCYGGCWGGCYGGGWSCFGCGGGCFGCGGGIAYGCGGGCFGCGGGCGGMAAMQGGGGRGGAGSQGGGRGGSGSQGGGSGSGSQGNGGGAGSQGGGGASAAATQTLQDLKKSVEELKKEQTQIRIDALKLTAEELRRKETDQKIDELRRDINEMRRRVPPPVRAVPPPPPPAKSQLELPRLQPAHITVRLPADARLTVHGVDCPLTSDTRTFDTPALAPGQKFYYLIKAEVMRNGRPIAQTRRVDFRSGERITVSFENLAVNLVTAR